MADRKEQSGVLVSYDSVKHIATVQSSGKPDRLIEVVGKALDFIKSKKQGATIGFHQNARGQMDAVYDAAITAGQMPLGEGRTDQGDPEKAPNGPKDVTPAEFRTPAPAPISATPAVTAGPPAVTPPPATGTAPAAPPAAAPPKGNGKLPQENREERICRECCLKCAVEMLKDQPGFVILSNMAQENRVVETAQTFFIYAMNGTVPGKEG
jgi:hypothetical protein